MVVICPSRDLNFGDPTPEQEFVRERLVWIELAPERLPPTVPPLQRALGMLLLPEEQLPDCSKAIRAEVAGTSLDAEIDDVIAAIMVSRFSGRTVPEVCARGCKSIRDCAAGLAELPAAAGIPPPQASCPPISRPTAAEPRPSPSAHTQCRSAPGCFAEDVAPGGSAWPAAHTW